MKDSSDESTRERKEAVPGIVGMNILSESKDMLPTCDISVNRDLNEVFTENSVFDSKSIHGFARVIGTIPIRIPADTDIVLNCTGPHIDGDVIINPLTNGGHLHCTVNTCTTVKKGRSWVRVGNIGDEDIQIKLHTMTGSVSKCATQN